MRHACSSASMPAPSGGSGALSVGTLGTSAMAVRPLQAAILFRLFTKVRNLVSCINSNHTSDVCHTTQKDNGPAYTESVSQIPPGAFNRRGIEERE